MQEILNDSRLPDPGQLITQGRLNTLRMQVEQLKSHKRNLCQEIENCEQRHRSKAQCIREESDKFRVDYEKMASGRPMITDSQFADMIVKAKQDMQREEEERISRYLNEMELRRRKQQQQQQRREAEVAAEAAESRRQAQEQQQTSRMQQSTQSAPLPSVLKPEERNTASVSMFIFLILFSTEKVFVCFASSFLNNLIALIRCDD